MWHLKTGSWTPWRLVSLETEIDISIWRPYVGQAGPRSGRARQAVHESLLGMSRLPCFELVVWVNADVHLAVRSLRGIVMWDRRSSKHLQGFTSDIYILAQAHTTFATSNMTGRHRTASFGLVTECRHYNAHHVVIFSSWSVVSHAFSAPCVYSKFWASSSSPRLPLCQILFLSRPPLLS